jgi:hypothetical protein
MTWYRIVGTEDERHLRAETNVESVRNAGEVVSYMAKSTPFLPISDPFNGALKRLTQKANS